MLSSSYIALLDACGLVDVTKRNYDSTELQISIIKSLEQLTKHVLPSSNDTNNSSSELKEEHGIMFDNEVQLSILRCHVHALLLAIRDEQETAFEAFEQERTEDFWNNNSQLGLFAIFSEFMLQTQYTKILCPILISRIDNFYWNLSRNNTKKDFRTIKHSLEYNPFGRSSLQRRLRSLIASHVEEPPRCLSNDTEHNSVHHCCDDNREGRIHVLLPSNLNIIKQSDIIDATTAFNCSSGKSAMKSNTFLLLCGAEGTGKSYICDTIGSVAQTLSIFGKRLS
jgi:hypothetical protein